MTLSKFSSAVTAVFALSMSTVTLAADDHKGHDHGDKNGAFKIQPGTKVAGSVKLDSKTQSVKFTLK